MLQSGVLLLLTDKCITEKQLYKFEACNPLAVRLLEVSAHLKGKVLM